MGRYTSGTRQIEGHAGPKKAAGRKSVEPFLFTRETAVRRKFNMQRN